MHPFSKREKLNTLRVSLIHHNFPSYFNILDYYVLRLLPPPLECTLVEHSDYFYICIYISYPEGSFCNRCLISICRKIEYKCWDCYYFKQNCRQRKKDWEDLYQHNTSLSSKISFFHIFDSFALKHLMCNYFMWYNLKNWLYNFCLLNWIFAFL